MHNISGAIGSRSALAPLAENLGGRPVNLAQGLAFLPLDEDNLAGIVDAADDEPVGEFEHLSPRLIRLLAEASLAGDLAYIETEYFGGAGGQGAAVFRAGAALVEPRYSDGEVIDEALAAIGVAPAPGDFDRFDTLGLGNHRSNEDWRALEASARGESRDE